jgi:hypothetical protein
MGRERDGYAGLFWGKAEEVGMRIARVRGSGLSYKTLSGGAAVYITQLPSPPAQGRWDR